MSQPRSEAVMLVHPSHDIEESPEWTHCRRCLRGQPLALRVACAGGNPGATHPRPWRAVPMDEAAPYGPWQVLARSMTGTGEAVVVTHLSELDARAIAAGGNAHTTLEGLR